MRKIKWTYRCTCACVCARVSKIPPKFHIFVIINRDLANDWKQQKGEKKYNNINNNNDNL